VQRVAYLKTLKRDRSAAAASYRANRPYQLGRVAEVPQEDRVTGARSL